MDNVQRTFIPGDSWVYYKIYTGAKTSDLILTEIIKPLVTQLLENNYIDQWFFIRYSDPKNHLRIRFHCTDRKYIGEIMREVYDWVYAFAKAELIHKIQLDTYTRELERYGHEHIEIAEKLFYAESEMVVNFLKLIDTEEQELRWLFALRALDELLENAEYTIERKMKLLERLKISFGKEFRMNKSLKKQLDIKFRNYKTRISEFLNFNTENDSEYDAIWEVLKIKRVASTTLIRDLMATTSERQVDNYLESYAHMLMNRMFHSKNRLYELVLYSLLYQHYKAVWGRKKFASQLKS